MKISQTLASFLSGNCCERCGLRMAMRPKKWCARCIQAWNNAKDIKDRPKRLLSDLRDSLGELYVRADIQHIAEPFKTQALEAPGDLYIYGGVGVGKTYLMAALLKLRALQGLECARINFDNFCSMIRSAMNSPKGLTEYEIVNQYAELDILFIDDIGLRSKQETDFAYVTLYSILNKRQENRLPTHISTNKSIVDLSKTFDARIASRLQTATIIHMTGPDRRQKV